MAPPAALRRRLHAEAKAAAPAASKPPSHLARYLCAVALGLGAAVAYFVRDQLGQGPALLDEEPNTVVARLLEKVDVAVRRSYNYTLALEHLRLALQLAPQSAAVAQLHGSVLLALGHDEAARKQLRRVFSSKTKVASDFHFLQQYVLALHRVGAKAELEAAWPGIAATPGLEWRSPLQCPDRVDSTLLEGAEPFPDPGGLGVTRLLQERRDEILAEFQAAWPGALPRFRPNQDNDLVSGNEAARWTEMLLFDRGRWEEGNCKLVPTACDLLRGRREVEGIVHGKRSGQVSLLKLEAGTTLVPHFGTVNWRYTAHLGLLVPANVTMFAGETSRQFRQGEILVLDDSFLHSVEHRGLGPRVTLFVNFFHPKMSPLTHEEWLEQGKPQ